MKWQPIETAPKDNEDGILGYDPCGAIRVVFWTEYNWPPEEKMPPGYWSDGDFRWEPSNWMPLPAPPGVNKEHTGIAKLLGIFRWFCCVLCLQWYRNGRRT